VAATAAAHLPERVIKISKYLKSLIELVVATYALSFLGALLADGFDIYNLGAVKAAAGAAVPAGLAIVYGALARFVGNFQSAVVVDTRGLVPAVRDGRD
jgi:hypothetical protein